MGDFTSSGFTPEQEQFVTEVVSHLCRRYGDVIEKLATEVHALTMVLVAHQGNRRPRRELTRHPLR